MEMAMEAQERSRTLSTGGQVNHVNVEEVEDQPDAVIGNFLIKSFTAIVLFDTGASHSYKVGGQAVLGRQNISPTPWLTGRHG